MNINNITNLYVSPDNFSELSGGTLFEIYDDNNVLISYDDYYIFKKKIKFDFQKDLFTQLTLLSKKNSTPDRVKGLKRSNLPYFYYNEDPQKIIIDMKQTEFACYFSLMLGDTTKTIENIIIENSNSDIVFSFEKNTIDFFNILNNFVNEFSVDDYLKLTNKSDSSLIPNTYYLQGVDLKNRNIQKLSFNSSILLTVDNQAELYKYFQKNNIIYPKIFNFKIIFKDENFKHFDDYKLKIFCNSKETELDFVYDEYTKKFINDKKVLIEPDSYLVGSNGNLKQITDSKPILTDKLDGSNIYTTINKLGLDNTIYDFRDVQISNEKIQSQLKITFKGDIFNLFNNKDNFYIEQSSQKIIVDNPFEKEITYENVRFKFIGVNYNGCDVCETSYTPKTTNKFSTSNYIIYDDHITITIPDIVPIEENDTGEITSEGLICVMPGSSNSVPKIRFSNIKFKNGTTIADISNHNENDTNIDFTKFPEDEILYFIHKHHSSFNFYFNRLGFATELISNLINIVEKYKTEFKIPFTFKKDGNSLFIVSDEINSDFGVLSFGYNFSKKTDLSNFLIDDIETFEATTGTTKKNYGEIIFGGKGSTKDFTQFIIPIDIDSHKDNYDKYNIIKNKNLFIKLETGNYFPISYRSFDLFGKKKIISNFGNYKNTNSTILNVFCNKNLIGINNYIIYLRTLMVPTIKKYERIDGE